MAIKKTPLQSYLDTKAKLEALQLSMSQAVDDIKSSIYKDMEELTSGASPDGKARAKWLRNSGHPYGRRFTDNTSKATNRQRGTGKKGGAPLLPIGRISGGLQSSKYVLKDRQGTSRWILSAGFNKKAKGAVYVVMPTGTYKMVARGIWGKSKNGAESGELGKRIKQYRKAFRDMYLAKNKKGTK